VGRQNPTAERPSFGRQSNGAITGQRASTSQKEWEEVTTKSGLRWESICESIGLSEFEAKAYLALVEEGAQRPRTLAAMTGIPVTKVQAVLGRLVEAGLAAKVSERPKRFAPTPPARALERYMKEYESRTRCLLQAVLFLGSF